MSVKRCVRFVIGAAIAAVLLAACSSSPSSTSTTKPSGPPPKGKVLIKHGTGNETLNATLGKGYDWTFVWHFDCGVTRGAFKMKIGKQGAKSFPVITTQLGLGGGGHTTTTTPYKGGTYTVKITTKCGWTLWKRVTPSKTTTTTTSVTTTTPTSAPVTSSSTTAPAATAATTTTATSTPAPAT